MSWSSWLARLTSTPHFDRGVHPPDWKHLSSECSIEVLPTPAQVLLPLHQHAGTPAELIVKPRDVVAWGDPVARARETGISAAVHAPFAGTIRPLTAVNLPNGKHSPAVPLEASDEHSPDPLTLRESLFGGSWPDNPAAGLTPGDIVATVLEAGIVGMGGAAFPTHIKLSPPPQKPVRTLLLNGCECEPYLTADDRLMREAPQAIIAGLQLAMAACGAREGVIAVEDNKPQAIAALRESIQGRSALRLVACPVKYPMGGERQLIPAVFGKAVPTGGLPLDLGIIVMNVGTAAAIAAAVLRGRPLTHRVLTVSGSGIRTPKNLLVPLGTALADVLSACDGLTEDARRVIAGGPMMGFTVTDLAIPVTKGTSGLTVLTQSDVKTEEETACIRCGRCVDVCPLNLMPTKMAHAVKHRDIALARSYDLEACCECGCCAYECPARIPLVQYLRAGKLAVHDHRRLTPPSGSATAH